jgi:hypothetical protein
LKTRPVEQLGSTEAIDEGIADLAVDSEMKEHFIHMTARALDVFTLMFAANAEESAKSVEWNNFVHAMSDVGFTARNGGGSAVIFENLLQVDGYSKIIFHKPHPTSKIDPIMLHSMGRRMTKWFGWHRDLFVLES